MLRQRIHITPFWSRLQYPPSRPLDKCVEATPLVCGRGGGRLFFTNSAAAFNSGTQSRGVGLSSPIVPLCRLNNHPDFRLRQAKERVALNLTMGGGEGKANGEIPIKRSKLLHKITRNENPVRSNDGTSSGAIAADRLRNARRNAIENMIVTFPQRSLVRPPRTSSFSELRSDQASSTKERGLAIKLIENPV